MISTISLLSKYVVQFFFFGCWNRITTKKLCGKTPTIFCEFDRHMSVLMLGIYFLLDLFHTKHQLFLLASGGFLMFISAQKTTKLSSFEHFCLCWFQWGAISIQWINMYSKSTISIFSSVLISLCEKKYIVKKANALIKQICPFRNYFKPFCNSASDVTYIIYLS